MSNSVQGASAQVENNPFPNLDKNRNQQMEEAAQVPQPVAEQIKTEEKKENKNFLQRASHPGVCLALILVKAIALADFLIMAIIIDNEALVYLTVIILGAIDFWITKNVAGRRLVGLRWWNEVKEDGSEVWIFESKNESKNI
ncbi:MAG: DUF846 domain-containing protein [archaeon]|nr:DUF846 domain-containing protein [archaeon]